MSIIYFLSRAKLFRQRAYRSLKAFQAHSRLHITVLRKTSQMAVSSVKNRISVLRQRIKYVTFRNRLKAAGLINEIHLLAEKSVRNYFKLAVMPQVRTEESALMS